MISDVPNGFEAHKLINISLGKIAASRSGRTGASLHKSLLVASVLHKARYVYLEEAHHYHHTIFCPPQGQPEEFVPDPPRAPTPLPEVTVTPVVTPVMPQDSAQNYQSEYDDDDADNDDDNNDDNNNEYPRSDDNISEECKSRLSGECDGESSDLDTLCYSRKRRRVSEQETEAAISSILPKRLKSENYETDPSCTDCYYSTETAFKYETKILCSCGFELASCQCADQPSAEEDEEVCNMEVDHITSLVSIFSFNQQQQQQQQSQQSASNASSDLCSKQAHHQSEAVGPPVLALTA